MEAPYLYYVVLIQVSDIHLFNDLITSALSPRRFATLSTSVVASSTEYAVTPKPRSPYPSYQTSNDVRRRGRINYEKQSNGTRTKGRCASGATASWRAFHRACGYDSSDAAVGGHAPIRCRNATILPR